MVGQVISLTPCVGSVARIMTRALYTVVNQKQSWNSKVELTKVACDELTFWIDNVDSLNSRCPWLPFQPPAGFVYSDASDYACSSFIIRVFGTHLWRSLWVLRLFTFFRNVVFELVHASACSRDWSFLLLTIALLVCQLPFGSSFSSGRFYFS